MHALGANAAHCSLRPTWLAIVAGRARPDEPEVVDGVQEEGW